LSKFAAFACLVDVKVASALASEAIPNTIKRHNTNNFLIELSPI